MKSIITISFILSIITFSFSQDYAVNLIRNNLHRQSLNSVSSADFKHITKRPGHYTADDWRALIDSTWGEGLPTADKLQIFDDVYNKIDREFACFHGLNINMDSLRQIYRAEIEAGVSRGRFAAIMNHFVMALKEGHTYCIDIPVNLGTPLEPGIPLFVVSPMTDNSHFGATLTPLPDSSLLIIKSLPEHPVGLVPGDRILGYDGVPWKNLYTELIAAQLPFHFGYLYKTTEHNNITNT